MEIEFNGMVNDLVNHAYVIKTLNIPVQVDISG